MTGSNLTPPDPDDVADEAYEVDLENVAAHELEMMERGAHQKGEGSVP